MRVSTVVAGTITNCRRSNMSPASSTPRTSTTPAPSHRRPSPVPGSRAVLTSTRYTCGMARATMLAASAVRSPASRRQAMGLSWGARRPRDWKSVVSRLFGMRISDCPVLRSCVFPQPYASGNPPSSASQKLSAASFWPHFPSSAPSRHSPTAPQPPPQQTLSQQWLDFSGRSRSNGHFSGDRIALNPRWAAIQPVWGVRLWAAWRRSAMAIRKNRPLLRER